MVNTYIHHHNYIYSVVPVTMSGSKAMTINGVKFLQGTETDVTGKGAFVLEV